MTLYGALRLSGYLFLQKNNMTKICRKAAKARRKEKRKD